MRQRCAYPESQLSSDDITVVLAVADKRLVDGQLLPRSESACEQVREPPEDYAPADPRLAARVR